MNNRPVEQALGNLVPTHASDLPQDLVSLATSLVAHSRSFSSSLKPEEEIARPYACAEIACRRYVFDLSAALGSNANYFHSTDISKPAGSLER